MSDDLAETLRAIVEMAARVARPVSRAASRQVPHVAELRWPYACKCTCDAKALVGELAEYLVLMAYAY